MKGEQPHTNPAYDREMQKMRGLLTDMENAVHGQLSDLEKAFASMNSQQADTISENDHRLNAMEGMALRQAIAVLACYQPVAEDLRTVVGTLLAAVEYERIGDYVKNFAKSIKLFVSHDEKLKVFPHLLEMTAAVRTQFENYLAAAEKDDLDAAMKVWRGDVAIDKHFHLVVREAVDYQGGGDGNTHSLMHVVTVASNLERMGDRVKNLVEILYYRKTGKMLEE